MKEQFVHTLTNSFMLWFDHFLLEKGEAYSNQTGTFYHTPDGFLDDNYTPFSSPYKQFVNDSSIAGAIIKTGIPELQGFQTYTGLSDNDAVDSFEVQMNPRLATPAEYSGITFHDHGETWRSYESGDSAPNEYWRFRVIDNGGPIWILNRISGASTLTHSTADITYPNPRSDYPWGMVWDDTNSNGLRNILSFDNPKDASNSDLDHETYSFATTILDYENGRIIETGSRLTDSSTITGTFAVKDFNIYFTNETEDDLVVENKYELNSRIPTYNESGIAPYDQVVPAIFLSTATMQNEGLAFGGEESTTVRANAVVLSDDPYKLDGVLSIFGDSHNEVFYPIPMSGHPVNEYGDLKGGSYSYDTLSSAYNSNKPFLVDNVTTSKLTDKARKSLANDLYVGFIDFDLKIHRFRFS